MSFISSIFQQGFKISERLPEYVRGLFLYVKIRLCGGVCKSVPRVGGGFVLRYPPHTGFSIGKNLRIGPGCVIECPPGATLSIGDRVGFTAFVVISSHQEILIGNDCLFAEGVSVRDAEHTTSPMTTISSQPLRQGVIRIEDDVWIGKGSIVLQDCVLQRGSILGANSLIKQCITEPFAIYAGAPARKIKVRT